MLTTSSPIIFYDIATCPPVSPNSWKTRLALNFKSLPYSTSWVGLPDIAKVRSSLKVPACRKFADGTDFFTLPIIQDPATGSLVGDSFDNAAPALFPAQTIDYCPDSEFPEYAKFNVNVDAAFSAHVQFTVQGFPFDPATAEISKAEFCRRAGVTCWEDLALAGEAREKMKDSLRDMLDGLGKLFLRDTSGPFTLGTRASYADFIVGRSEWEEVRSWHGGLFGRLHDALEVYAEVG
ncbi:uncharacterized protein BDW43DRAFT_300670 [Aspergillus alliaceus]|uniref:uncharacterized protein n=1 Tax=Petromyces alliaceus TaxID=209559 RepID=UPI0012A6FFC5|nr:uncharacterized protein BDW43DRAFT_300670 [Aspergillus alliaceus]KAB8232909.1 hypothetical protein BDW43DRAFT_300670 [Aspergillus alliaceus]